MMLVTVVGCMPASFATLYLLLPVFLQRLFESLREVSDEVRPLLGLLRFGVAGDFEIAVGPVFAAGFEVVAGVGF